MVGNETGDMMLDQGLTRAQMAAVLTRIVANPDHVEADSAYYRGQCKFTDVPDWAKVYVGYCAANHLVAGYGNGLYGPSDPVTPAAACTVMLRCLGDVDMEWTYSTACQTAVELGLSSAEALTGAEITRGNMAVLIYRTMAKMGYDTAGFPAISSPAIPVALISCRTVPTAPPASAPKRSWPSIWSLEAPMRSRGCCWGVSRIIRMTRTNTRPT